MSTSPLVDPPVVAVVGSVFAGIADESDEGVAHGPVAGDVRAAAVAAAPAAAAPILIRSQTSTARSFSSDIASPNPPAPETRRVNW